MEMVAWIGLILAALFFVFWLIAVRSERQMARDLESLRSDLAVTKADLKTVRDRRRSLTDTDQDRVDLLRHFGRILQDTMNKSQNLAKEFLVLHKETIKGRDIRNHPSGFNLKNFSLKDICLELRERAESLEEVPPSIAHDMSGVYEQIKTVKETCERTVKPNTSKSRLGKRLARNPDDPVLLERNENGNPVEIPGARSKTLPERLDDMLRTSDEELAS